jgi:hypothetical protein
MTQANAFEADSEDADLAFASGRTEPTQEVNLQHVVIMGLELLSFLSTTREVGYQLPVNVFCFLVILKSSCYMLHASWLTLLGNTAAYLDL